MQTGWPMPYILGGQPPNCAHCWSDTPVTKYCAFKSEGQARLLQGPGSYSQDCAVPSTATRAGCVCLARVGPAEDVH